MFNEGLLVIETQPIELADDPDLPIWAVAVEI